MPVHVFSGDESGALRLGQHVGDAAGIVGVQGAQPSRLHRARLRIDFFFEQIGRADQATGRKGGVRAARIALRTLAAASCVESRRSTVLHTLPAMFSSGP
jgi:hypothetical protein